MPARDTIADAVKNALVKDGWSITDDPYLIKYEDVTLMADLAAETVLAAERGERKVVVEAKSFLMKSSYNAFQNAVGQYIVYRTFMSVTAPERDLYMAVSSTVYEKFFSKKSVQFVVAENSIKLLVVRIKDEEVDSWIE